MLPISFQDWRMCLCSGPFFLLRRHHGCPWGAFVCREWETCSSQTNKCLKKNMNANQFKLLKPFWQTKAHSRGLHETTSDLFEVCWLPTFRKTSRYRLIDHLLLQCPICLQNLTCSRVQGISLPIFSCHYSSNSEMS